MNSVNCALNFYKERFDDKEFVEKADVEQNYNIQK